jgi:hypothetical protein
MAVLVKRGKGCDQVADCFKFAGEVDFSWHTFKSIPEAPKAEDAGFGEEKNRRRQQ